MSKKNLLPGVILILVIVGLFSLSSFLSPNRDKIKSWKDAGVECLSNGHANLLQHIHQHLTVVVDGTNVTVPANIGVLNECLSEIHTHEGEESLIHVESLEADKEFSLRDFFTVWGESFDRDGYARTVVVDLATSTENDGPILKDKQIIQVIYVGSSEQKNQ